ncbi:putative Coilin/sw [Daphnia magna]|uniref:Putative Coilin/sw n=1 Tax=Daphnia magna TaxID=35525 RepID=A0A164KVT3_9CRUS|nr:putative Coilin/sw [Daphnia magna]
MPNLRVRLEFPDGEKYWLFIDSSKIETIQDVIDDIDQKYSVVCEKLLLDDAQLYCKEPIGILQERDLIRVNLRTSKKRKKETEGNQNVNSLEPVEVEGSKAEEVKQSNSLSKPKKKKKCKEDNVVEHESFRNDTHTITPASKSPVIEKQKKVKNTAREVETETTVVEKQSWVEPEAEPEMEVTITGNTTELNTMDKEPSAEGGAKRKRRRKRKSHHKAEAVDSSLPQTFQAQQYCLPPAPKERQHLRFDEDSGDDTEPETGRVDMVTTGFDNHVKNESNGLDRTNRPPVEDAKAKYIKNFAKAGVYQSPSATSSPIVPQLGALLSLRSAVFSRNSYDKSAPSSYNNVPPPQSLTPKEVVPSSPRVSAPLPVTESPKLDPTTFPIIKGLPRVNDLIAFKVLELSENYNPEISDYMQGRITHMSADSDITVQLLDPKPKRNTRGKFELIELDEEEFEEEPEIEYESTVTYQWNQMIEPRLIFP